MATTAPSVRPGWWESDSRKVFSWRWGLKGSAGHCAASFCSWFPTVLVVIAKLAGGGADDQRSFKLMQNGDPTNCKFAWDNPTVHFGPSVPSFIFPPWMG